jgi:hypothetical protein
MQDYAATLARDPALLRGLRHSLLDWLDRSGAPIAESESMVLATHSAAAHAMEEGDDDCTVEVTASRDGARAFVIHVRSTSGWDTSGAHVQGGPLGRISALVSHISLQSSSTVRMRTDV